MPKYIINDNEIKNYLNSLKSSTISRTSLVEYLVKKYKVSKQTAYEKIKNLVLNKILEEPNKLLKINKSILKQSLES